MAEFVVFDGNVLPADDAEIACMSPAALYGTGVFTTIAIFGQKPHLWDMHWLRLQDHALKSGVNISAHRHAGTYESLSQLLEVNGVIDGRARITLFDVSGGTMWSEPTSATSSVLITTATGFREVPPDFRLTVSPYRINSSSPLAGVKSCNYLEKILALNEAKERGFDEAIQLNERGEITSACMANVFWLQDEKLHTPGLGTGCLAGTTREFVLETLECSETETGIGELEAAEAIFLTSAGIGVVEVAEFEGRRFGWSNHEILKLLPAF